MSFKILVEKAIVVAVGIGIAVGVYFFAYNEGAKSTTVLNPVPESEAVQWVIKNPKYAEKLYEAYGKHIKAAESQLEVELDAIGGVQATGKE